MNIEPTDKIYHTGYRYKSPKSGVIFVARVGKIIRDDPAALGQIIIFAESKCETCGTAKK